jgi:PIN domain nuclease of toxin-antitoxin system
MGSIQVNLLLDTHIWLWWINQNDQLTPQHQDIITQAENAYISSISCWELVMLHQRNRIELIEPLQEWIRSALQNIVCLPLTETIAIQSALLGFHHRDPADRFIISTALIHDCQLMSFDEKFVLYPELENRLIGK